MKFNKALSEKQGVPKHPKAAAKKRKETEIKHFGKEAVEKVSKTAEKLKGVAGIETPHALARWMHYGKFAGEREEAKSRRK